MDDLTKPARRYIANAIANPGGFLAQYAFPGVVPRYVTSAGRPLLFASSDEAEDAARVALFHALNNRPSQKGPPERYRLMSGDDLARAVDAAGITPTFFAYLWGCGTERFFQWIDGTADRSGRVLRPPHAVRLLLETWRQFPATLDLAEQITEQVTSERKPRRMTD